MKISAPVTVGIVDDHPVVRDGLQLFLEASREVRVAFAASTAEQALASLHLQEANVVLMDLVLPGPMDGIAAIHAISRLHPSVRVVALTSFQDTQRMRAALQAGAVGYLEKTVTPAALLDAVRRAALGQTVLDSRALMALAGDSGQPVLLDPLTRREEDVLRALGEGLSNKEIAARLGIAEKTVKVHLGHIFSKLDVYDRTQAVLTAHRLGIISL